MHDVLLLVSTVVLWSRGWCHGCRQPQLAAASAWTAPARCCVMKVSELLRRGTVIPHLSSRTKTAVLDELLIALVNAGCVPREGLQEIAAALTAREKLGTTGIGRGIAVPNAKHNLIPYTLAVLGRSGQGIEFESLDGAPVYVLLMVLSNQRISTDHVRALASAVRLFRDESTMSAILTANTQDEILHVIDAAESTWT